MKWGDDMSKKKNKILELEKEKEALNFLLAGTSTLYQIEIIKERLNTIEEEILQVKKPFNIINFFKKLKNNRKKKKQIKGLNLKIKAAASEKAFDKVKTLNRQVIMLESDYSDIEDDITDATCTTLLQENRKR